MGTRCLQKIQQQFQEVGHLQHVCTLVLQQMPGSNYRDIQDLSALHLRLRWAESSPLAGAGSPRCQGLTSTQKASWQGILHRQCNPQTRLQRQNTLKPLQKCKTVVPSLFAKTVSMTASSLLVLVLAFYRFTARKTTGCEAKPLYTAR